MPMDEKKKSAIVIRKLLLSLWREQNAAWVNAPASSRARKLCDDLARRYPPASERGIESALPSEDELTADFGGRRQYLYLPPFAGNPATVGVLSLVCNLAASPTVVRLYVLLFTDVPDEGTRAVCYRFETPEGPGGGLHDFHHAQPTSDLRGRDPGSGLPCPSWIPDGLPAFPLRANCPVTLVLYMLVSLYGPSFARYFTSRDSFCWPYVQDVARDIAGASR